MVLTTVLAMMRYVSETDDRDFVDRLHSYFTTNLLIGLSVLVSFKQFGGKPIECLVPDIFSGAWEQYAENYCWAQDTYFVAPSISVEGMEKGERGQRRISYYQWVPFFLLLEAACFRIPSLLWRYMSGHSGIKLREVIKMSSDPNNINPSIRRANIKATTLHLQGALRFHKRLMKNQIRPHRVFRIFNLPYSASYVTIMYLLTKFCYLFNVLFQLFIMNSFLETDKYSLYGFGALLDLLNGTTWEQSGIFPRVALCDFEVRVMGNLQDYTIQCVLVINIFNEKIFVLLWFWYLFLFSLTFGSFLFWLGVVLFPWPNRRFIGQHLEMCEMQFDADARHKDVERFIDDYLRLDGIFVIRMLTLHTGVIFGTDLVQAMWQNYFDYEETALKRCSSFPDVGTGGEFSPRSRSRKQSKADLENAVGQFSGQKNRRRSAGQQQQQQQKPKISIGSEPLATAEQLLVPPASPTGRAILDRLEHSRTASVGSVRSGSPPDAETAKKTTISPRERKHDHSKGGGQQRGEGDERGEIVAQRGGGGDSLTGRRLGEETQQQQQKQSWQSVESVGGGERGDGGGGGTRQRLPVVAEQRAWREEGGTTEETSAAESSSSRSSKFVTARNNTSNSSTSSPPTSPHNQFY